MIKLENTITPSGEQWKAVIMGCRNPMNSWDKSDSDRFLITPATGGYLRVYEGDDEEFGIGPNDQKLMLQLCKAGSDHRKFMRMLQVYVEVTAPLYWWKEMDTYKIGTVANSCSTMHKIADKEFTLEDFSCEHLLTDNAITFNYVPGDFRIINNKQWLMFTIDLLNGMRDAYLETKNKIFWWQMIQLLPSSYNQKRTLMLNYETLRNIYHARKGHKLDEWEEFRKWIETLPFSELITGEEKEK